MERYWSVKEARNYASGLGISLTSPTIIRYIRDFEVGIKIGGRWYLYIKKWKSFLERKFSDDTKNNTPYEEKEITHQANT